MVDKEEIIKKVILFLKNIYDPEIPVNIYELGLIYEIKLKEVEYGYNCYIDMTLTSTACPVAEVLVQQVINIAFLIDELQEMYVNLVFDPPWDANEMISYEAKLELGLL